MYIAILYAHRAFESDWPCCVCDCLKPCWCWLHVVARVYLSLGYNFLQKLLSYITIIICSKVFSIPCQSLHTVCITPLVNCEMWAYGSEAKEMVTFWLRFVALLSSFSAGFLLYFIRVTDGAIWWLFSRNRKKNGVSHKPWCRCPQWCFRRHTQTISQRHVQVKISCG